MCQQNNKINHKINIMNLKFKVDSFIEVYTIVDLQWYIVEDNIAVN